MGAQDLLVLEVIAKVEAKKLTRFEAETLLQISNRTLKRYLQDYREEGIAFIRHGNKSRAPKNKLAPDLKRQVQNLMKEKYFDFNMVHAIEKLREEGIDIKRETFRSWCHEIGLVKRAKKRRSKPRYKRTRMSQSGLLIQMDGSHHRWFDNRETCLIAAIDDATSEVVAAEFFEGETTFACLKLLKDLIKARGVFKILYVDKAGIYGGIKREGFSQVGRALEEVGAQIIFAHSPEAKGRVERLFQTLQDRLVAEMRLNKIRTIEQANEFLKTVYLPHQHNPRYSVQPHDLKPAYQALPAHCDLEEIFCVKDYRVVNRDHTISWGGELYMITDQLRFSIHKQKIEIRAGHPGDWRPYFAGKPIRLVKVEKLKKMIA
jgi:transposase